MKTIRGREIYVDEKHDHVASISVSTGRIRVSPEFEGLDELQKEFVITQLLCLKEAGGNLIVADKKAIEQMMAEHPEKDKKFWHLLLLKLLKAYPSDINAVRIKNISDEQN